MSLLLAGLSRFALGAAGGSIAALAAFGRSVFEPGEPAFESLSVALLGAALLTLVRAERRAEALVLMLAYGLLRLGLGGWTAGLGGLGLGAGAFAVSLIFDELAQVGVRFGKFLIVGPLLGGACLAVAPLILLGEPGFQDSLRPLVVHLFMGIVIGDGIGIGVELAELLPWSSPRPLPAGVIPAAAGPPAEPAE